MSFKDLYDEKLKIKKLNEARKQNLNKWLFDTLNVVQEVGLQVFYYDGELLIRQPHWLGMGKKLFLIKAELGYHTRYEWWGTPTGDEIRIEVRDEHNIFVAFLRASATAEGKSKLQADILEKLAKLIVDSGI